MPSRWSKAFLWFGLLIANVLAWRTLNALLNTYDLHPEEVIVDLLGAIATPETIEFWRWVAILLLALVSLGLAFAFLRWRAAGKSIPIAVEINGMQSFSAQHPWADYETSEGTKEQKVMIFGFGEILLTNTSLERSVSLDIFLCVTGKGEDRTNFKLPATPVGPWGLVLGQNEKASRQFASHAGLRVDYYKNPVELSPSTHQRHILVFLEDLPDEEMQFSVVRKVAMSQYNYSIRITDHLSGVTINRTIPFSYRG